MRSSDLRSARLGTVMACLMAAMMPLASAEAQVIGKPGLRQRAVPDLVSLILYFPPINLGGGPPPPPGPQGGREAEGAVILSGNAPAGGAVITLSSGNTALLHVPATVTVPAGANFVKFRYDPLPVAEPTTATASAVYSGQTRTASVLILPPPLVALTLDSLQLQGGNKTNGLVKLDPPGHRKCDPESAQRDRWSSGDRYRHAEWRRRSGRCAGEVGEQQHRHRDRAG